MGQSFLAELLYCLQSNCSTLVNWNKMERCLNTTHLRGTNIDFGCKSTNHVARVCTLVFHMFDLVHTNRYTKYI